MNLKPDWLWDKRVTAGKAKRILSNPKGKHFLSLASLLLSRKNTPKEVFKGYLAPLDFLRYWSKIKRQMRKNRWNNPRIEFWQAIYERLKEKYAQKGVSVSKEVVALKPPHTFCKLIADKIRLVRKQKGLTQAELAQKLKISQQVISRIEKGRENISLLTLRRITQALGAELYLEISPRPEQEK